MEQQTYSSVTEQSRYHNETNDCAVKALAIACNVAYSTAHAMLKKHGRKDRKGTFHYTTFAAIKELGFEAVKVDRLTARTVKTVGRSYKDGRYLVFVHRHVAAMVDGKIIDWTEGRCHRIKSLYKIVDANAPVVEPSPVPAPEAEPLPKRMKGTDRFGSKIGSQSALINATMLDYSWFSVERLADATGLSQSRVRNHINWLMDRGYVSKSLGSSFYQLNLKYTN